MPTLPSIDLQAIMSDFKAVMVAFLALCGAVAQLLAVLPLPQTSPIVKFLNKLAGNYGNASNTPPAPKA